MPDLKVAANTLAVFRKNIMRDNYCDCRACSPANWPESNGWKCVTSYRADALLLAAQALEAWAWQQEKGADVQYDIEDDSFVCDTFNGQYRRCTPLGAVLAAMEGEKDGEA